MSKYMSQIPPNPKPTAGPAKRNPKAVVPKPAKRLKRDENQAGPRVIKPKAKPVGPDLGIMGSTPKKKDAVKQRMLDDMRKRGMLSKARKKKM